MQHLLGATLPVNFPSAGSFPLWLNGADEKMPKPKEWTEGEVRRLIKLARGGAGVSKLAVVLDRHAGSVRRMARNIGNATEEVAERGSLHHVQAHKIGRGKQLSL